MDFGEIPESIFPSNPINIYYNMTAKKIPPAAARGIASRDI
jgi:hypothetical protein